MTDCPRCGGQVAEGQEYCLECGVRLPGEGPVGRPRDLGQGWVLRAAVAAVVALGGAAVAVAATGGGTDAAEVVTATGGFVTTPEDSTSTSPTEEVPVPAVEWPAGDDGWTVVLASIPQTEGRRMAMRRAVDARRAGLTAVGILDSSQYASLHPGYWVVFTGVHGAEAEATSALQAARRFARTATVRHVVP
jgi:hypothetical protein